MVLFLCSQLQSHLVQLPELITVISIVFFYFIMRMMVIITDI